MARESVESIRHDVLARLCDATSAGRKPEAIKASPENYHLLLVAFMHQLGMSENGIELFGIPLLIDHEIAEIAVSLG